MGADNLDSASTIMQTNVGALLAPRAQRGRALIAAATERRPHPQRRRRPQSERTRCCCPGWLRSPPSSAAPAGSRAPSADSRPAPCQQPRGHSEFWWASCGFVSGCEAHHGGGAASASLLAADSDPRPLLRRDELAAHGGGASATATDGASPAMHAERSDLSPLVVAQEGQRIDGAPSRGDDEPRMEGRTTVVATLAGGERVGTA